MGFFGNVLKLLTVYENFPVATPHIAFGGKFWLAFIDIDSTNSVLEPQFEHFAFEAQSESDITSQNIQSKSDMTIHSIIAELNQDK